MTPNFTLIEKNLGLKGNPKPQTPELEHLAVKSTPYTL